MNDYFAGSLAHERHADYLREVEHDELVARVQRPTEIDAGGAEPGSVAHPTGSWWRSLLTHLVPSRLAARSHRP